MDGSPPDPTAAEPPTPIGQPQAAPSRAATRAGSGISAVGGLGALVGFFLPWLVFEAIIQTSCRIQIVQVELYNLYGIAVTLGNAGDAASALAFVALLCVIAIITIAIMSARRPRLFRIRLLVAASLVGLVALGLLGAFAASGQVALTGKNLYGTFLGFGLGFWVTTGSLALALVGGAVLHAAARPRLRGAPIGEIALAFLGVAGLLSSTAAAVVVRPAQYPLPTCVNRGNAPHSDGGAVYFTSADGVYAVDAASGRLQWRCRNPLGGVVTDGAPALAGGVLYVASRDDYVYAIRADNAAVLWRADVGPRGDMTQTPHVAPIVADGLVFGVNGAGEVYALRASDGARAWSSDVVRPAAFRPAIPALLHTNGELIYLDIHLELAAVDERTGQLLWQAYNPQQPLQWPPNPMGSDQVVVESGIIYDEETSALINELYLVARSTSDGAIRWRYLISPDVLHRSAFTLVGGVVYLAQSRTGGNSSVVALGAHEGEIVRSPSLPLDVYVQPGLLLAGDSDTLYQLAPSGEVTAVDVRAGAILWRFNETAIPTTRSPVPGSLALGVPPVGGSATGLLYVATVNLSALNPADGAVRWQFTPDKPVTPYAQPQSGLLPFVPSPIISPPTLAP